MKAVKNILELAKSYVGYLEKASNYMLEDKTANSGSANYTIFAKKYADYGFGNYQGQPWCAMAVTVIFYDALGYENASGIIEPYSYCPYGINDWKKKGRWHNERSYIPQAGDIIFFGNGNESTHTGIVRASDDDRVYTYEGNTSDGTSLVANGGAFCEKSYTKNYSRIMGYGNPDWSILEEEIDMEELIALKEKIKDIDNSLTNVYRILNDEIEPEIKKSKTVYDYIDNNMPQWAKDAVKWCREIGIIQGDENGKLGLDNTKLWTCVVLYRLSEYLKG